MPTGVYKRTKVAWNKGKTMSEESKKKKSETMKRVRPHLLEEHKRKISNSAKVNRMKTKKRMEEEWGGGQRDHLIKGFLLGGEKTRFKKGITPWNTKKHLTEEHKRKIGDGNTGKIPSTKTKEKLRQASIKNWENEDYRKAVLGKREKSSLELKFEDIINKNQLPYKFVGNGEFFIERKCPDFININGEKIAIEVYYRTHKEYFKKEGLKGWKRERKKIFNKYGWNILFFDETQVNNEHVCRVLAQEVS